jgi:hypothetical protein
MTGRDVYAELVRLFAKDPSAREKACDEIIRSAPPGEIGDPSSIRCLSDEVLAGAYARILRRQWPARYGSADPEAN